MRKFQVLKATVSFVVIDKTLINMMIFLMALVALQMLYLLLQLNTLSLMQEIQEVSCADQEKLYNYLSITNHRMKFKSQE